MTTSPTAQAYRDLLGGLRTLLLTEMAPLKPTGWLGEAKDCVIGLHAAEAADQPAGLYILPVLDKADEYETNSYLHPLEVKVIITIKALGADHGQSNPPTLRLADLAGGVFDLIQKNRSLTLTGGYVARFSMSTTRDPIPFIIIPIESGGLLYRAEVNILAEFETFTT